MQTKAQWNKQTEHQLAYEIKHFSQDHTGTWLGLTPATRTKERGEGLINEPPVTLQTKRVVKKRHHQGLGRHRRPTAPDQQ